MSSLIAVDMVGIIWDILEYISEWCNLQLDLLCNKNLLNSPGQLCKISEAESHETEDINLVSDILVKPVREGPRMSAMFNWWNSI